MEHLIKTLRLQKGWSQEELAEIADISVRTVQRLENGANCSLESAKALASAFDTQADVFLKALPTSQDIPVQEQLEQIKQEQATRKKYKFYRHLLVYILINTLMIIQNLTSSPDSLWFFYPLLGWGTGLLFHAFKTFGLPWEKPFTSTA